MNINLKLTGVVENILENMIKLGVASNKTEAIRIALLEYNNKLKQFSEDHLVY